MFLILVMYDYFSKYPKMGNALLSTIVFSAHLGSEI
ncbi:hypothetical protein EV200_10679 [Pedobacter psychrotolerans]|uniref:Uncharacterized protein n=1 Tax=Pedobacter psychrotolerans TaxID=1843235 RepID=A0A4R2H870_9SPHI|nr:hypothetical protein EV200_10679 [Pedobacter psychrotolerans]